MTDRTKGPFPLYDTSRPDFGCTGSAADDLHRAQAQLPDGVTDDVRVTHHDDLGFVRTDVAGRRRRRFRGGDRPHLVAVPVEVVVRKPEHDELTHPRRDLSRRLELEAEDTDAEDALSADGVAGDFRFNGVDFSYTADRTVLRNVTCHIPAKRTTLIIGHTGAGKSTIAKMLLRLYPPKSGQITLDGQPLNDYRIRSLRKRVAP